MNVRDLDLNLLRIFAAVHEARGVGRAAERLGLSQPAVSHAVARLRQALHDPLFVRAPGGVRATPRADQLARQVEAALRLVDAALAEAQVFDAARSTRRFTLHLSDIGADEFLPLLMADLATLAPGIGVCTAQLGADDIAPALDEGRLDLAVGYLPSLVGTETAPLVDERYVVLLRRGHPRSASARLRAGLAQLEFVLVASHAEPARALQALGLQDRIRLTLPHFLVVPPVLAATDLACIVPLRPARRFAERHGLQVVEADLGLPPFTVAMHWTWRQQHDPGHRWLRERLLALRLADVARAPGAAAGARGGASSGRRAGRKR